MRNDALIIDTTQSPAATLHGVPLDRVHWTEGFWRQRFTQAHQVTVRRLWERLSDPEAGHVLDNFRIAAGRRDGETKGTWWQDAWLYKWIEAAACFYRVTGDTWLDERMDEGIELIGAAQAPDGYVWTHLANPGKKRFEYIRHHEVYAMGHLLTAAVTHRRMTGKESFFELGQHVGDFLCHTLGISVEPCFAHNPSAIMGLVELYRETREERYLDCARLIVDSRGTKPAGHGRDMWHPAGGIEGTDQIQDRVPLRDSAEVVGHNVFFTYLFTGAADVLLETGDETLAPALERLWHDLVTRKMNVNGGVSPMGHGLSLRHDKVVEAVGPAYFLPNADAYNETCGQIGNLMWNQRLLHHDPQARYADMVEWEIYNGILPGIGMDGASWWYRNPLRRNAADHTSTGHNDLVERDRVVGLKRICCPTNLLRTVAQFQAYAYGVADHAVWVHQYGANRAELDVPGTSPLTLTQETDYPWSGAIRLTLQTAPEERVSLRLRVPGWAEGASLRINGEPGPESPAPGTYVALDRQWESGDCVELNLPMPARLLEAHPYVEHCRNQVAVARGPVLYCLESPDLPEGVDVADVVLPVAVDLKPAEVDAFTMPLTVLEGEALQRPSDSPWDQSLYRPLQQTKLTPLPLRLIPYFAWANRGPAAMSVWLPVAW